MKTIFSLINFVVAVVALLIGAGNFLFLENTPASVVAGSVATVVSLIFLWLATQAMFSRSKQT